jgi:hypothetical protein
MADTTIYLRGLKCPLPALRTRKALRGMAVDDVLVVECTGPARGHRHPEPDQPDPGLLKPRRGRSRCSPSDRKR